MKKIITLTLTLVAMCSLIALPAAAEGEIIEQDGFVCERLRDGNLKLVDYTGEDNENNINIPSTVNGSQIERIGANAFDGCNAVNITIPDTVGMIESFAFNDCKEIQKISIPNSVYFLDGNPFTGCTQLVNISIDPNHPTLQVTTDGALYSKRNKMLLCYPCSKPEQHFTVMEGTVTIGKNAFYGCDLLQSIQLPATVKEIGDSAFEGCNGLISITLPESMLTIGEYAFAGCASLSSITLPKQISIIEKSAFLNCTSLSNVSFPENLTEIEDMAFYGCEALQEIHLPENATSIGANAFDGCASLADVFVPVAVTEIGDDAFENCDVRLYFHVDEYAFAEIYAKLYDISYTYDDKDSFLTVGEE